MRYPLILAAGLAALFALLPTPARAEEETADRTIELPNKGLSIAEPDGWTVQQYTGADLKLSKGHAIVWFYLQEAPREDAAANLRRMADRVANDAPDAEQPKLGEWTVRGATEAHRLSYVEDGQRRFFGVIEREGLPGFDVEAIWPPDCPKPVRQELGRMLESVDVTPYEHPDRLVDWTLGFTLDGVDDWSTSTEEQTVRLESVTGGHAAIRIRAAPGSSSQAVTRLDRVIESSLERVRRAGFEATAGPIERIELVRTYGDPVPGIRMSVTLARDDVVAGKITLEAVLDGDLALVVAGADEGLAKARAVARTFRATTDPGPRKGQSAGTDEFPSDLGPELRFALPAGWTLEGTEKAMRLATFHPGGELVGVAYFFGEGSGGSLDANVERWKGQWPHAEYELKTLEPAEGLTVTVLDVVGNDQRALFVYIQVAGGPVTLKLVGPDETVAGIADAFYAWLGTYRVE